MLLTTSVADSCLHMSNQTKGMYVVLSESQQLAWNLVKRYARTVPEKYNICVMNECSTRRGLTSFGQVVRPVQAALQPLQPHIPFYAHF